MKIKIVPKISTGWYLMGIFLFFVPSIMLVFVNFLFGSGSSKVDEVNGWSYFIGWGLIMVWPIIVVHFLWSRYFQQFALDNQGIYKKVVGRSEVSISWEKLTQIKISIWPNQRVSFITSGKSISIPLPLNNLEECSDYIFKYCPPGILNNYKNVYNTYRKSRGINTVVKLALVLLLSLTPAYLFFYAYRSTFVLVGCLTDRVELIKVGQLFNADLNEDIESIRKKGRAVNALVVAVASKSYNAVEYLLASGADLNLPDKVHNRTPAYYAVQNSDVHLLKKLLERGARVETEDTYGLTLEEYAKKSGCEQCIEIISSGRVR